MPDEKTHADGLRLYLTGADSDGGAQTDPDASLGKYRSSSEVSQLGITVTNPISNVTIAHAAGINGTGNGSMTATGTSELKWTPPGGTQGAGVTIANGETKILEGGTDTDKYIRVSRTSADDLTGTATVTLAEVNNNVLGYDDVSSSEASSGDTEYRCFAIKNETAGNITSIKFWLNTLGTQRVSAAGQLGASGAGTISISAGTFDDWPDSGYCRITQSGGTLREIVYYSSRTSTALTVPAAGRELLGTSASAGAATDTVDAVPGIAIAKDAPTAQPDGSFEDETGTGEGTDPGVGGWVTGISSSSGYLDIGTLATLNIYGIWLKREMPVSTLATPSVSNAVKWSFDIA